MTYGGPIFSTGIFCLTDIIISLVDINFRPLVLMYTVSSKNWPPVCVIQLLSVSWIEHNECAVSSIGKTLKIVLLIENNFEYSDYNKAVVCRKLLVINLEILVTKNQFLKLYQKLSCKDLRCSKVTLT